MAAPPASSHVLVIDDDFAIRDLLSQVLEDEGYLVQTAANGMEALTQLRVNSDQPCVILLDLMMPLMNGWQFRSEQQRDVRLSAIPVIVLSADRNFRDSAAILQAAAYLSKPIDFKALLRMVGQYCRCATDSAHKGV